MKKVTVREELNSVDKDVLITMIISLREQLSKSNETIDSLRARVDRLTEQISIMNMRMFGKSGEKSLVTSDQLSILDFGFNEA